jgi:streptogramin lyase
VVAIDAETGAIDGVVSVGGDPLLLTEARGRIWTLDFVPGALSRIDPLTFERTVVELDGQAVGMASDGDDIWATADERFLVRVDGVSGVVESTTPLAEERLFRLRDAGFLAVADGEAWVTIPVIGDASAPQELWRIDAVAGTVRSRYPLPRDPLTPIVAHGAVWVPVLGSSGLVRLDLATDERTDIHLGDLPLSVAAGPDSIWVALERSRSVMRLDPGDGDVVAEIMVDTPPRGVAFGDDRVWIATEGGLSEIDPTTGAVKRELRLVERTRGAGGTDVAFLDGQVWLSIE